MIKDGKAYADDTEQLQVPFDIDIFLLNVSSPTP